VAGCGRFRVELLAEDAGTRDGAIDCPTACENPHGSADCSSGTCLASCAIGYADCDANPGNGCEVDTAGDDQSCGSCGRTCSNAHGATSCRAGLCVPVCSAGFLSCDDDGTNGCEADLASAGSCGGCDATCTNAHGTTSCIASACAPSCDAGFADCDGDLRNGCEVNLASDPAHCGVCPTACDRDTQICSAGVCQLSPCSAGRGECDSDSTLACETDLTSTLGDCGFCGNLCTAAHGSAACVASACTVASCALGYGDCNGTAGDGCEVTLATSTAHCGGCTNACTNAHGTVSCVGSMCAPACSSGFGDCDTSRPNGCETTLNTVSNCGMCGRVCPANGGTPACSAGVCTTMCNLTGSYALKLTIPVTWPGTGVLSSGSGTYVWWSKLVLTQSGNTLTGTVGACGETVPDFASTPFIGENYGVTYPNTVFDGTPLPSTSTSGTVSAPSPGSAFALARSAILIGVSMADPVYGAWPSAGGVTSSDGDGDGKPGITAPYKSGGSYDAAPLNSLGTARASRAYLASRAVFTLNGTLDSCSQASGTASVQYIDYHTIGCLRTSGSDCSSGEWGYLDNNGPDYQVNPATYRLVKLPGAGTCAEVRAAAP
jgi:hypothetical protein